VGILGAFVPPKSELPLTKAIPRFIQMQLPLPPLKLMAQSRRGANQVMEGQTHLMAKAIPKFIQIHMLYLIPRII
jgi:hypothetical protein